MFYEGKSPLRYHGNVLDCLLIVKKKSALIRRGKFLLCLWKPQSLKTWLLLTFNNE